MLFLDPESLSSFVEQQQFTSVLDSKDNEVYIAQDRMEPEADCRLPNGCHSIDHSIMIPKGELREMGVAFLVATKYSSCTNQASRTHTAILMLTGLFIKDAQNKLFPLCGIIA